jgi:hypothetical protein
MLAAEIEWSINEAKYGDPKTTREALSREGAEGEGFRAAMLEESDYMVDDELVEPCDRHDLERTDVVIKSKFAPHLKFDPVTGKPKVFKMRWVPLGCFTIPGLHYDPFGTNSPVAHLSTIMFFFTLVAQFGLDTAHMDITKAFGHGDLEGYRVFVELPKGLESYDRFWKFGEQRTVWRVKKAIYGYVKYRIRQLFKCFVLMDRMFI